MAQDKLSQTAENSLLARCPFICLDMEVCMFVDLSESSLMVTELVRIMSVADTMIMVSVSFLILTFMTVAIVSEVSFHIVLHL